ncbi:MAG TPA: hypothetical protein VKS01_00495 [Bryobacteraceae bacterium]|nr:hypothetical protein [Bryobacteraceae bacterium]
MPVLVKGFSALVGYAVVLYGIYKVYTISNEVSELKEMIRDIRSLLDARAAVERANAPQSTENLIRAVNAASYQVPEIENVSESH